MKTIKGLRATDPRGTDLIKITEKGSELLCRGLYARLCRERLKRYWRYLEAEHFKKRVRS